jgi:nucleoside-diphosphate-sugar epimerase
VEDPIASNSANVDGTLHLLVAARDAGVRRVVYASSSSIYGDEPTSPKRETMLPSPISPYGVSKLAGEHYMAVFYRCYGLETVSLRYFNVFGPHQDPTSSYSGVLAIFITHMLADKQCTIFGDGTQSRDFTFVENVIQANLLACAAPAKSVCGHAFNAATGTRIDLNETFKLLKKLTGYNRDPAYGPERAGDIKHSLSDGSMAEKQFGYRSLVGFEEGMRRYVEWYRKAQAAGPGAN